MCTHDLHIDIDWMYVPGLNDVENWFHIPLERAEKISLHFISPTSSLHCLYTTFAGVVFNLVDIVFCPHTE